MRTTFNGHEVEIDDIVISRSVEDCYIQAAYYVEKENGRDLDDDELAMLTDDNYEIIYEAWFESYMDRADAMADRMKEG